MARRKEQAEAERALSAAAAAGAETELTRAKRKKPGDPPDEPRPNVDAPADDGQAAEGPEGSEGIEGTGGTGAQEQKPESRFARLRKKKDMPGGLWLKCESCGEMMYKKELEERGRVCPSCDFHFTLPGKERIAMVLDPGSWEEHFAGIKTQDRLGFNEGVPYLEKVARAEQRTGQSEALLCGTGTLEGRPLVLVVLDFSFMGGSMGEVVGEKIALACELARVRRLPLVIFTSSGGARMHEGALSLMQMAKTSAALAEFNDAGGFSICVMTHPTTGGVTASFASVCDLTLAEPGALIGFAGPRVIANTLKQELPAGFQRAEFLLEKGQLDRIVHRDELRNELARLIDYGTASPR